MKKDIQNSEDIKLLVDDFYDQARKDKLLGPVFERAIHDWDDHFEKLYAFWDSLLFDRNTYFGSPFQPHTNLEINQTYFDRWLELFFQTTDCYFEGSKAEEIKERASKMGQMFANKLAYYNKLRNE